MDKAEALARIAETDGNSIVVEHVRTGTRYWLERDVVENSTDGFVYGHYVDRSLRRRGTYRWFFLKNVRYSHGDRAA